ncbi:TPA: response regulator [Patescibacteria group bacterium]|nr:response regulator receiver protein [candidate division SR1 bacterium RAAC1_SR1_1]HCY20960.1 response regulator [Candidatus Gracilibacteria bacterium]
MRVLVVDDDSTNIMLLDRILKRMGIVDIAIAENGKEAVEICKENDFNTILMDIRMPIMDGFEATKIIKEMKEINIVALTTHPIEDIYSQYKEAGFDYYISKPIKANILEEYFQLLKN